MSKSKSNRPSKYSLQAKNAEFRFRKDGIYVVDDKNIRTRIADPIRVTAFATSYPGMGPERAFTVVRFLNRRAKWKTEIIPSSMLTAQTGEFVSLLSTRGYMWPTNKKLWPPIIASLSNERPGRDIRVTSVPGWHGRSFALPGESYGPNGPDRKKLQIAHNPTVRMGEFGRAGTLDEWKQFVAKKCMHSTRARLAVAANFAAPNLRILGLNSFGFNFSGMTSGGKTLLLRSAASTSGLNRDGGPGTWDGTPAGFEQRVQGHRDCIVPLDDISYLEGDQTKMAKLITFRLAGNRPKEKAGQYVVAQNLVEAESRVIALSTSEDSLWAHLDKAGRRRIRGEEVRMINVRACVSDMEDIFDGPKASKVVGKTVEQRRGFVEALEQHAVVYQGEAFRAYLTKRAADKGARAALKAYMADYVAAAPLPGQQRWLARIQRLFAVVYAGAAQAIDYGILPWSKRSTLRAIKNCMDDAMDQLIAASGEASVLDAHSNQSDQSLITEFKRRVGSATFVRLKPNRKKNGRSRKRLEKADGIVRPTKSGKVERLLFARAFEAWFPEAAARNRVTKLLRARHVFRRGRRSDTNTRQIKIAELGTRVPCYALSRKRLRT
jgi:putative DNA primase/helicase